MYDLVWSAPMIYYVYRFQCNLFLIIKGQYDSVIKANSFLERYVLDKLQSEVAAKLVSTAYESPSGNKGELPGHNPTVNIVCSSTGV